MKYMAHHLLIICRWLLLSGGGLLLYALLRAFYAIVYLGAPWYDWSWYVPVMELLFFMLVHLAWQWQYTRSIARTYIILLLLIGMSYNGFGHVEQLSPAQPAPIRISFWTGLDFRNVPESMVRDIQIAGGYIYIGRGNGSFNETAHQTLAADVRRLATYDIQVYLIPALSKFLSVPVYREWDEHVHNAAIYVQREQLTNVRGVIGDAENPQDLPLDIAGVEQPELSQAVQGLGRLISTLHRDYPNFQIGVTASWPQYVDKLDGDSDWAIIMRSPVDPPGHWDLVNVMTYSSYFPAEARAYYVYAVERGMARLYPHKQVSHLIGLVGTAPAEPALEFDELVRDARISHALGVSEIVVFYLDAALRVFDPDFIKRFNGAVNGPQANQPVAVTFSRTASLFMYGVALVDALMDVRGSVGWLWLGWIAISGVIVWRRSCSER